MLNEILTDAAEEPQAVGAVRDRLAPEQVEALLRTVTISSPASHKKRRLLMELAPALHGPQIDDALDWISNAPLDNTTISLLGILLPARANPRPALINKLFETSLDQDSLAELAGGFQVIWRWISEAQRSIAVERISSALTQKSAIENGTGELSGLIPSLPEALIARILEAVLEIPSAEERFELLGQLFPFVEGDLRKKVADSAFRIWVNLNVSYESLHGLVPFFDDLEPVLQDFAFNTLVENAISEGLEQAQLWIAFASSRPDEWLQKAIERSLRAIDDASTAYRSAAILEKLVPYLSEATIGPALEATDRIRLGRARARAITHLLAKTPEAWKERVVKMGLEASCEIDDWHGHFDLLEALAPCMPRDRLPAALELTEQARDIALRSFGMSVMAQNLGDEPLRHEWIGRTLDCARGVVSGFRLARVVAALLPHLDDAHRRDALDIAFSIDEESSRSWEVSGSAISMVFKMKPGPTRASLVADLAASMDRSALPQIVKQIGEIKSEDLRSDALAALAPLAAPTLLMPALACAQAIQSRPFKALAIAALDISSCAIDISVKTKLKSNLRAAKRAARGHFGDIGNKAEVTLQWRGNGGGHHFRTGSRHRCLDHQRRKIDLGQRSYREVQKSQNACKGNAYGQQCCRYRA
jgi:hypothetical protein